MQNPRSSSRSPLAARCQSSSPSKPRSWTQLTKKIHYQPSPSDLDKSNLLRPSDSFFRLLLLTLSNKPNLTLNVNIPEVFAQDTGDYLEMDEGNCKGKGKENGIGRVRFRSGVSFQWFMQQVEATNHGFLEGLRSRPELYRFYANRIFNQLGSTNAVPYLIYKEVDSEEKSMLKIQPYEGYRRLKKRIDGTRLIRRFVYPRGTSTAILRYCHRPQHPSTNQLYLLQNTRSILDPTNQLKRTPIKPKDIWLIHLPTPTSYHLLATKPHSTTIPTQSHNLLHFLQSTYHIKISILVTDWIQDTNHVTWLIKLQYIQYLPIPEYTIPRESFAYSVNCRLCGERFRKEDAQKTVTYKLIEEMLVHLKQRGRKCGLNMSSSMIRSCKVCDLCYMLVLGEYELINVEKEFGRACGIPVGDLMRRVSIINTPTIRPSQVPVNLYQWRLFFYLNELIGLQPYPDIDLTLSLRIHNRTSLFRIGCISSPNYKVNRVRIHYLFSQQPNISKFQSQTQVFLRLIHSKDKSKSVAQGSFSSLHFTKPQVQRRSQQVLLFYQNAQYCEMELKIGLICDGVFDTSTLNLHEHCGAYLTDQTYTNANFLPDQWMEIFDMEYSAKRSNDMSTQLQEGEVQRIMGERLSRGRDMEEEGEAGGVGGGVQS